MRPDSATKSYQPFTIVRMEGHTLFKSWYMYKEYVIYGWSESPLRFFCCSCCGSSTAFRQVVPVGQQPAAGVNSLRLLSAAVVGNSPAAGCLWP